jgi:hypothetical protein
MIKGYKTLENVESSVCEFNLYFGNVEIPIVSIEYNDIRFNGPVTELGTLIIDCSVLGVNGEPPLLSAILGIGFESGYGYGLQFVLNGCVKHLLSQDRCQETGITEVSDLEGYYISGYLVKEGRNYSIVLENIKKEKKRKRKFVG